MNPWLIALLIVLAAIVLGGGPMMGYAPWGFAPWGGFGMGLGILFMLAFWGLLIWVIVAFVRWASRQGGPPYESHRETSLDILKARYARGEISKEEFEEKKRDLV